MQNCWNGVKLTFHLLTEASNVTWVKQNVHQATNAYHEVHCVTFGTKSPTDQRDAMQRLRGLKDGKHAVTAAAIENEINRDGLHIEPPPLSLQIRPNVDDMDTSEGPAAPIVDPTTSTQLDKVEGDVQQIKRNMQAMNTKIDDMPNSILDALRRDRAEERRLPEGKP